MTIKNSILDIAQDLLQTRGINGFSYRDIAEPLGVKNAAIHYHFTNKDDLVVAIIRRYREQFSEWQRYQTTEQRTPQEQIAAYARLLNRFFHKDRICPITMVCAEFESASIPLREETKALMEDVRTWLTELLETGYRSGNLRFQQSPDAMAQLILSALQGALTMSRAGGSEILATVAQQIDLLITAAPSLHSMNALGETP